MLQLGNPGSSGNSNHPVLGELGQAAKALMSTTGVKLKDEAPVAGEMSLCLIIQRTMGINSQRICDFCDSLSKKTLTYHPKAVLLSTLAPQLLCSWLSAWPGTGPDVG